MATLFRLCWLCEREVDLRTCKIDEYGEPGHEACYRVRLDFENRKGSPITPINIRPKGKVERQD